MKDSCLQCLEGTKVIRVEHVHDYVQLAFQHGRSLSIYNDWSLSPETALINDCVGAILNAVTETEEFIVLDFFSLLQLVVDLRHDAYHGPEAVQFDSVGLPTVIWNGLT